MQFKGIWKEVYRPLIFILTLIGAVLLSGLYLSSLQGRFSGVYENQTWWLVAAFVLLIIAYIPQLKQWKPREALGSGEGYMESVKVRGHNTRRMLRRFFKNWRGPLGLVLISAFLVLAAFPGFFMPQELPEYSWLEFRDMDKGPSSVHRLGLTHEGDDIWSIIVSGARPVLFFGVQAAVIAVLVGGVMGALAGYMGGGVDRAFTFVSEVVLAFPSLFMMITILSITGNSEHRLWLIVLFGAASTAKVVRAEALSLRTNEYVTAAQATGCSDLQTVFNHILINATPVLIVQATIFSGQAIMLDAYVNFLGVAGAAGWAGAIADSINQFRALAVYREPWLVGSAGGALFLLIAAFNLVGDALRDALDVRI